MIPIAAPEAPELAPMQPLAGPLPQAVHLRPAAVAAALELELVGICPICPEDRAQPAAFPAVVCHDCMGRGPAPMGDSPAP